MFAYLLALPFGFGEMPRFRCNTGDRFVGRLIMIVPPVIKMIKRTNFHCFVFLPKKFEKLLFAPFSFSGDGDDPQPVAEFLRDGVNRTVASKWRNLE